MDDETGQVEDERLDDVTGGLLNGPEPELPEGLLGEVEPCGWEK